MGQLTLARCRPPNVVFLLVVMIMLMTKMSQADFSIGHQTENSTLLAEKAIPFKPSYVVLASRFIEPGAPYRVVVTLYRTDRRSTSTLSQLFNLPSTIYVRILRHGTVVASETRECYVGTTEIVSIKIPDHLRSDEDSTVYNLDVEGNVYGKLYGSLFQHKSKIFLKRPNVRVLLQTEQIAYRQQQTVRIRAIPIRSDARPWLEPIDLYLNDPRGMEMARWSARSAANGPIQIEYELAEPTIFGRWTISASARGTAAQKTRSSLNFEVLDYDPVGFEVRVWTRSSYVPSDGVIEGWIEAELLNGGAPVQGLLSMNATLKTPGGTICEQKLRFKKDVQINNKHAITFEDGAREKASFSGRFEFALEWSELEDNCNLAKVLQDQAELKIHAVVSRQENGQRVSAHANTILNENNLKIGFSINSPATFHPDLPFITWVWVQRGDGRPLSAQALEDGQLLISAEVNWEDGRRLPIQPFPLLRSRLRGKNKHLWNLRLDLTQHLEQRSTTGLKSVTIKATFVSSDHPEDHAGQLLDRHQHAEMILIPIKENSAEPEKPVHQLQITTSTTNPKVGENIILHIRSNFFLRDFHCVVTASGQILTTKLVNMGQSRLQTFDELVTGEMAPEATFTVWHVDERGNIVSSSMTVIVHSHERARINAHPVLEGSSGYAHVSISGEPHSILSLTANGADQRERLNAAPEILHTFEDRNLVVQNGIPFPGTLESKNDDQLIVMSDGGKLYDDDNENTDGGSRGRRRLPSPGTTVTPNQACSGDVIRCDGVCQCATCEDETECENPVFRLISSPTLNELRPTGFWKVVRIPGNGTATLRVPFAAHGRVAISALSLGPRGVAAIRGQTLSMGGYLRSHLELPPACRSGERISVRLTCVNRGSGTLKRTYEVASVPGEGSFDFLTPEGARMDLPLRKIDVTVAPHSFRLIQIPIIPLQTGFLSVRAKVDNTGDRLLARTHVLPEGVTVESSTVLTVDLNGRSSFVGNVGGSPNLRGVRSETTLTVSAGVVGPLLPFNVTPAIGQPQITSDEALFTIAMILHERGHHRSAFSRGRVSEVSEASVRSSLSLAIQRLLAHQREDGAVSYYRVEKSGAPSVYLTASALRVLYEIHTHFDSPVIDPLIIVRSLDWLIRQQSEDGSFKEVFVYNGEYQRKLPIEFQEIALTAHVLISLSPFIEKSALWNVTLPIAYGARYLASRLGSLDRSATSLDTAIVSRALQVTKSHGSEAAFEILAKRRRELFDVAFWGNPEDCDSALSVRATAYALMVYTERGEHMTEPIVRWINSQRKSAAGWGSTVDTTIATEALVLWSARFNQQPSPSNSPSKNDLPNYDSTGNLVLEVDTQTDDVTSDDVTSGNGRRRNIVVIASGVESSRVMPLGNVTRALKVEARGSGIALVHLQTRHVTTNVRHLVAENGDESKRNNVAIHLEPRLEFSGRDSTDIRVLSCQRWDCNKDTSVSGPAVLSMSVPTGYILDHEESSRMSASGHEVWIRDQNIVIFFHKLTAEYDCVDFTLRRNLPVARLSPYIQMKVYDWFSPDRRNETLLFVPKLNSVTICDVCGSFECPDCIERNQPVAVNSYATSYINKSSLTFYSLCFLSILLNNLAFVN